MTTLCDRCAATALDDGAPAHWADDMMRTAHAQRRILIEQLLMELKDGEISDDLQLAIKAHDDFLAVLTKLH